MQDCPLLSLPQEVIEIIYKFMDQESKVRFSSTCTFTKQLLDTHKLWRKVTIDVSNIQRKFSSVKAFIIKKKIEELIITNDEDYYLQEDKLTGSPKPINDKTEHNYVRLVTMDIIYEQGLFLDLLLHIKSTLVKFTYTDPFGLRNRSIKTLSKCRKLRQLGIPYLMP